MLFVLFRFVHVTLGKRQINGAVIAVNHSCVVETFPARMFSHRPLYPLFHLQKARCRASQDHSCQNTGQELPTAQCPRFLGG